MDKERGSENSRPIDCYVDEPQITCFRIIGQLKKCIQKHTFNRQTSPDLVRFGAHRQEDGGDVGRQCSLPPHIDHDNIRRVHQNGTRSGGDAGGKHGGAIRQAGGQEVDAGWSVHVSEVGRKGGRLPTCPFSTIA